MGHVDSSSYFVSRFSGLLWNRAVQVKSLLTIENSVIIFIYSRMECEIYRCLRKIRDMEETVLFTMLTADYKKRLRVHVFY